jgi:hypothetical protein
MQKLILGLVTLIVILGLLLGGCIPSGNNTPSNNTPSNNVPIDNTLDTPVIPTDNTPSDPTPVFDNPPPEDVTWISPGKVTVTNFYPGATAEYPVTIHNGNNDFTSFSVNYRSPDNMATGYARPPAEVQYWVIIADETPILAPRETRDILVTLTMPANAAVFSEKWEFWISISDATQSGQVQTAMAIRWLISCRAQQ